MVKIQFGKNWSWHNADQHESEISDKKLEMVYRLDASKCYNGSCKYKKFLVLIENIFILFENFNDE